MSKRSSLVLLSALLMVGALLLAGCARGSLPGSAANADRAPLSEVCGDTSGAARPGSTVPAKPDSLPRVTDNGAHLSYLQAPDPWVPWRRAISPGHLGALFNTGYYLVTQAATPTGEYYASVLSGRVYPGQQRHPDLACVAAQVADDLHSAAYPGPNRRTDVADRAMIFGGRPAHMTRFRIDYDIPGYAANSELVTVLVIDTGRADLSLLYASIPDTARQYESLVDKVIASIKLL